MRTIACILIGYLLGSVNPAFFIGKMQGYDVRESGSQNAGASNTVIMSGKLAGLFVALTDIFKSAAAWKICTVLFPQLRIAGILGGISAVIGHMYSVFLHFTGGKGLACMGGVILAYRPSTFLILFCVALLIAFITDYVVFVTVGMSYIWPLYFAMTTGFVLGALLLAIPAIPITWKHRINFRRILSGDELRLSYLWKKEEELKRIGRNE